MVWKEASTSHSSQKRGGRSPHHELPARTSVSFSQNFSQIVRFAVKDIDARLGLPYYCSAMLGYTSGVGLSFSSVIAEHRSSIEVSFQSSGRFQVIWQWLDNSSIFFPPRFLFA